MIRSCIAVAALVGALAACQTESKPGIRMSHSEMQQLSGEIARRCLGSGAKKDTPAMDACIRQETRKEVAARAR